MSTVIFKLVNGDDIISDVELKGAESILKNPAKLMMFPTESGGMGMALVPWCPYTNQEDFTISSIHILAEIIPPEELVNSYREQFGSGIVAPSSSLIL